SLHCGLRIEALGGINHGRAMGDAAQVTHDHAEAVIKWHGDANFILRRNILQFRDKIAVIEDVVMAECSSLGEAGGSTGVLDVNWIVKFLRPLDLLERFLAHVIAQGQQTGPGKHTGNAVRTDANDRSKMREFLRLQLTNLAL